MIKKLTKEQQDLAKDVKRAVIKKAGKKVPRDIKDALRRSVELDKRLDLLMRDEYIEVTINNNFYNLVKKSGQLRKKLILDFKAYRDELIDCILSDIGPMLENHKSANAKLTIETQALKDQ